MRERLEKLVYEYNQTADEINQTQQQLSQLAEKRVFIAGQISLLQELLAEQPTDEQQ